MTLLSQLNNYDKLLRGVYALIIALLEENYCRLKCFPANSSWLLFSHEGETTINSLLELKEIYTI